MSLNDNSIPPRHYVLYNNPFYGVAIFIGLIIISFWVWKSILFKKAMVTQNRQKSSIKMQSKFKKRIKTDSRINTSPIKIPMEQEIDNIEVPIVPGKTSQKQKGKFKHFKVVSKPESTIKTLEQIFKNYQFHSLYRKCQVESLEQQRKRTSQQIKKEKEKKKQQEPIDQHKTKSNNRVFDGQNSTALIRKIQSSKQFEAQLIDKKKPGKLTPFVPVGESLQKAGVPLEKTQNEIKQPKNIPPPPNLFSINLENQIEKKPQIEKPKINQQKNETKVFPKSEKINKQDKKDAPLFPFAPKNDLPPLQTKKNQKLEIPNFDKANPSELLQKILQFSGQIKKQCQIDHRINNLDGALTSLQDLLAKAKNFIAGVNHGNMKQVDAFCIKVWQFIIFTAIRNCHKKNGAERMPPNKHSDDIYKNTINKFILYINLYRAMGYERIWLIIFGKTLDMLSFIYKRSKPISKFRELQLIGLNYVGVKKVIVPLYLSRIDYLLYFLIGLTTLDPVEVFKQVAQRTGQQHQASMNQVINLNYKWEYRQFWCLVGAILENKNIFYFKPIIYSNILALIYMQVRINKKNPNQFIEFNTLFKTILAKSNKFMRESETSPQIQALKAEEENNDGPNEYQFDGDEFFEDIQNLCNRNKQKQRDITKSLKEFEEKSSILYYFKSI